MEEIMKKTKAIYLVAVFAVSALLLSSVNAQTIPEEARRHMARGQAAVEIAKSPDEYDSAIKEFQQASRLAPDWPDPYYNLAILQEKTGKLKEAVASFKQYLRLAPNAPDAAKIQEQVYKLEYKAEQALTVPEIIDVLVSFSDKQKWQQYDGECIGWSLHITREGDDVVKALNAWLYYPQHKSYKTLNVTGPTLKYISTINVCDASANREFGGCDSIIENKMEVVSMTLVKINQKVIRAGTFRGVYRDGDERSCKYRKK
jgi:tetratricopeptide (TPR) repeat protein